MTIKKPLYLLDVLENHIPSGLYDAINESNIVEQEVEIEISSYHKGRPAVMHLRNGDPGYPADPAEWDEVPAEDYGCRVLARLIAKAATDDGLRKELMRPSFAGKDILHTIRKVVNDTIETWDNSEEVAAEVAAQDEYRAECAAEAAAERALGWE